LPVEKSWSFRVTRTDEPAQLRFVFRNVAWSCPAGACVRRSSWGSLLTPASVLAYRAARTQLPHTN